MKVLTVCLGNICRSPAAQGILEYKARMKGVFLEVDSAGTAGYHVGSAPDRRSIETLRKRKIDISQQKARQISTQDFYDFDWVLVMDRSNLRNVLAICPAGFEHKVTLIGCLPNGQDHGEVADPYYGNHDGFEVMADHLDGLADDFLALIRK